MPLESINSIVKIQTYLKESFHLISTGMVNGFDLMIRVRMFFKVTQLKVMRLINSGNPSNSKSSKLNDSCHSQIIDIRSNPASMKSNPWSSKKVKKGNKKSLEVQGIIKWKVVRTSSLQVLIIVVQSFSYNSQR